MSLPPSNKSASAGPPDLSAAPAPNASTMLGPPHVAVSPVAANLGPDINAPTKNPTQNDVLSSDLHVDATTSQAPISQAPISQAIPPLPTLDDPSIRGSGQSPDNVHSAAQSLSTGSKALAWVSGTGCAATSVYLLLWSTPTPLHFLSGLFLLGLSAVFASPLLRTPSLPAPPQLPPPSASIMGDAFGGPKDQPKEPQNEDDLSMLKNGIGVSQAKSTEFTVPPQIISEGKTPKSILDAPPQSPPPKDPHQPSGT